MNKRIFKFHLFSHDEPIKMQQGAEILHVAEQHGYVCIWALVEPEAPIVKRKIEVAGTDQLVSDGGKYIGTIITSGGALVWHFFDHGEL
jgi:hypothetical protein